MRKRLLSILKYIIFLGAGFFLVWWQLRGMTEEEKKEFYNAFSYANYWLIIPIIFMSLLSHFLRAVRWKILMAPLGYKPTLKNVFSVVMIGYLANSAIPRLGEILKCTFLARYEKLKVEKLVGTMIVERTFDIFCYLIFIGLTILVQFNLIGGYVKEKFNKIGSSSVFPVWLKVLIVIAIVVFIILLIKYLFKKYPQNRIVARLNILMKGFFEGFKTIKNLKQRKLFLMHTLLIWALYLVQIYIGFKAMEGTSHLSITAACSVLTLATLAMIATPGGIGSFPLFVMETLAIYGIATPLGEAFGWLIWGVSTGIIIIAGLVCLLLLPYINRKKNEISQQHSQ